MPLSTHQLTAFFENGPQMNLTGDQRTALWDEGIDSLDDFQDFKKEELIVAFKNVRSQTPPVPIPARSTTRILIASVAWNYYHNTGREVTAANMNFTNVLYEFNIE